MRTEKKLPNISDVARAAGVSTATVSHTLNGTRTVSEHSRELVMKAIRELGYTPNAFARSFRTGKKNIIGFVVPDISNQFFARLIEAVEESISAEGFHLIIANTRENKERERQHLRYLTSGVVDGILLASTMETYGEFSDFLPEQFPAVLVDRKVDAAPFSSVTATPAAAGTTVITCHASATEPSAAEAMTVTSCASVTFFAVTVAVLFFPALTEAYSSSPAARLQTIPVPVRFSGTNVAVNTVEIPR